MHATQLNLDWLLKLETAANDSMLDDYPSVRAAGAQNLKSMLTPMAVLQLIEMAKKNITNL